MTVTRKLGMTVAFDQVLLGFQYPLVAKTPKRTSYIFAYGFARDGRGGILLPSDAAVRSE